jgi:hypothetical protein
MFRFSHLGSDLRDLIGREAQQQIAEIDKELKALGFAPDEFEDDDSDDVTVAKIAKKA